MRTYFYERLGTDIRSQLIRKSIERAVRGESTLYLAPSREVIFSVRDRIEGLQGGIVHIQVGGMEDLERRLLPLDHTRHLIHQKTGVRMVQAILQEYRDKKPVQLFAAAADQEGLARLLLGQMKRVKRHNLTPRELHARLTASAVPAEKQPVWDLLTVVYEEYQKRLEAHSLWDVDDLSMQAARAGHVDREKLPHFLVLDGFINVDPVHRDMLGKVLELCPDVDSTAGIPFYTEASDPFLTREIIRDLESLGFALEQTPGNLPLQTMQSEDLAVHLFDVDAPALEKAAKPDILDAPCLEDEVRQVMHRVRRLLESGDAVPHEIALVVREQDAYQGVLAHVAEELSVPLQMTVMLPLYSSHLVKDILRILADQDQQSERGAYGGPALLQATEKGAEAVEWLQAFWPDEDLPVRYCEQLAHWLQRGCIPDLLEDLHRQSRIPTEWLYRETSALQVLAEMLADMQASYEVLPDERSLPAADFLLLLQREIEERSVPGARPLGGVKVLDPDLLRGVSYDHVFLMGLNDGVFPRTGVGDLFASPGAFESGHLPVQDAVWEMEREKIRFAMVCAAARLNLTMSYRTAGEDGSFLLPAPFLQDAAQRLGLRLEPRRSMRDRFEIDPDQIASTEELLRFWAARGVPGTETQAPFPAVPEGFGLEERMRRITHSARVEARRFSPAPADRYDGSLPEIPFSQQDPEYPFSASQLNDYRLCPFRYLSGKVLALRPEEEEEEISSRYVGKMYHRILTQYYSREPDALELQTDTLEACIAEAAEEMNTFPYNRLFLETKTQEIRERLRGFLEYDLENRYAVLDQTGRVLKPTYLEWNVEDRQAVPGVRLKAHIDRVDLEMENGVPTGRYVVYDYKTKTIKGVRDILKGDDLQLPLYVLLSRNAVARDLKRRDVECMGALFYSIGGKEKKGLVRDDTKEALGLGSRSRGIHPDRWDGLMDIFRQRIMNLVEKIRLGKFTLPGHCPLQSPYAPFSCDYKHMCRYHAERLKGKGGEDHG